MAKIHVKIIHERDLNEAGKLILDGTICKVVRMGPYYVIGRIDTNSSYLKNFFKRSGIDRVDL